MVMEKIFKRLITNIYKSQRSNSKTRCHKPPDYTKDQLKNWILSQPNFEELYNNWVKNDYQKDLIPSCDRLNNDKSYTFNNLRLVTFKENREKYYKDIRENIINHSSNPHKAVLQFDKNDNFIKEYYSQAQASRETNIKRWNICSVCNNKLKSAGGYIWKYK